MISEQVPLHKWEYVKLRPMFPLFFFFFFFFSLILLGLGSLLLLGGGREGRVMRTQLAEMALAMTKKVPRLG